MAPKAVLAVERLPLTNNGKVDRRVLAAIATAAFAADVSHTAVSEQLWTPKEEMLRELWAIVLNVPASSISLNDHFV
jgi:hypothetical protein